MPIYIPALLPMIFCETICSPCLEKNNIVFHPDCSEKSLPQCLHSIEINLFSKNRITEHILFRQGILRKIISTLHLPAELNNITAWSFETSLPVLKKLQAEIRKRNDGKI